MPPIMFFSNFPISYARWASTPIMYQQCNCDNGNNKWLNWWMMSEMVKNIGQMFRKPEKQPPIPYAYNPYQQYTQPYQTMYPYVNLNNTQQYPLTEQDEGLRELQEAYKNCKTKFSFVKVNDKYIAIDKDGKRIKADTAEELMDLIDAKVDGGGGLKPEEEVPPAEEVPPVDEGNDPPTDPPKRTVVPQGWVNGKSLLDVDSKHKNLKHGDNDFYSNRQVILHSKDNAAETTIDLLLLNSDLEIKDQAKRNQLKQTLIDANPSIYDEDGKLLDGVTGETLNKKLDVPTAEILKRTFAATEKKSPKNSTIGKIKHNIIVDEISYSEGVEWKSGNKFYKNQEGSWSDWDRDGYFLIQGNKFTLKVLQISESNVSMGKEITVGDEVDYGELLGTSEYINREKPIFKLDNGNVTFRGDYDTKYEMQNSEGKGIGKVYAKNGKTVFLSYNDNKEYDMAEIMAGNIELLSFWNIKK